MHRPVRHGPFFVTALPDEHLIEIGHRKVSLQPGAGGSACCGSPSMETTIRAPDVFGENDPAAHTLRAAAVPRRPAPRGRARGAADPVARAAGERFVARLPEAIGALKVDSYHVFATGGEAEKSLARVPVEIVIVLEAVDLTAILQPQAPGIPAGDD